MGRQLVILVAKLVINALAMLAVSAMFQRIQFDNLQAVIAAALMLALVNAYLRPLVVLLTLPINLLTLGLFTLIINAGLLLFISWLIPGFHVVGFWNAFWSALAISIVSCLLNWFLRPPAVKVRVYRP